jgi:FkbM family methyltransferase
MKKDESAVDSNDLLGRQMEGVDSQSNPLPQSRVTISRWIKNHLREPYVFLFGRPSMQALNNIVLNLALNAKGYANYYRCHPKWTGEEKFLKLFSKHNPQLCIDIGANKGDYSEILLSLTDSRVIAFEPLPKTFAILAKLQTRFPRRLITLNKGVGDQNAELDLHFGDEDSTLASFSKEVNEIDYVGQNNWNAIRMEVITLDRFFKEFHEPESSQIDLLKIDTEGYEYEVLLGAKETLENRKPKFIQIEYNWHQLFKGQSLYKLASLLPNYVAYQLLPHGSGLNKVDVKRPESNIYHYSNFVFVREDISKLV